jgi:hypothetical protein
MNRKVFYIAQVPSRVVSKVSTKGPCGPKSTHLLSKYIRGRMYPTALTRWVAVESSACMRGVLHIIDRLGTPMLYWARPQLEFLW